MPWKGAPFGHLDNPPDAKPEQDAFLHPGVDFPAGGRIRVRLGGANPAFVQRCFEFVKGAGVFLATLAHPSCVEFLDFLLELLLTASEFRKLIETGLLLERNAQNGSGGRESQRACLLARANTLD